MPRTLPCMHAVALYQSAGGATLALDCAERHRLAGSGASTARVGASTGARAWGAGAGSAGAGNGHLGGAGQGAMCVAGLGADGGPGAAAWDSVQQGQRRRRRWAQGSTRR
jgi:hypothetical protein